MEKKKFDVEFHGTNLFALVPLLLFVVFCILFFVVFKTFDMMHLCMGGYVALIIGSLLSKNWGKYWDAVATGMSSKIMNELALILLIVGMFMDNISSCTILAPILLPVATALGVNPVHFGILMTMNLAVGFITPPYGVNLFVGSSVARIPFERVVKWIWPLIGTILVVLLLTTYVPQLSLLLV